VSKNGSEPGPFNWEAVESRVKRRILEEAEEKARKLSEKLKSIGDEEIAELIREERDSR